MLIITGIEMSMVLTGFFLINPLLSIRTEFKETTGKMLVKKTLHDLTSKKMVGSEYPLPEHLKT